MTTSPLEEKNTTAGRRNHVTFGNNHRSISNQICKTTSEGVDVQNWESSTHSKDMALNVESTAFADISSKGYIPSVRSKDDPASPTKDNVVVLENISSVAGDPSTAPINMATNEDDVATTSRICLISITVLGDISSATHSEGATPDPGVIRNISSGEKVAGTADTSSAVSPGDPTIATPSLGSTLVFVDTNGTRIISNPDDHTKTAGDINTSTGDTPADPVSDSGEISHTTSKEASSSLPGDTAVLLQDGTVEVFTTDTSGIIPTFSATTEYITSDQSLPAISGSTSDLACNDSNAAVEGTCVTGGPRDSFTNGNQTDTLSREANASISAVPTTTSRDVCKASTDGLNVSRNATSTVEATKCPVTIESGDTSVIIGTNSTAVGNISPTHLDTVIINESSLISGNVTDTVTPRNMTTAPGKKPTTSMTQGDTHYGDGNTSLSCGNSMKASNLTEEVTGESEDSTTEPDSLPVSGNSHATVCVAIIGAVDSTTREDAVATTPENINQMETSSSPQNGAIVLAGENPTTTQKKSSGDSSAKASLGGSTASVVTMGASTTTTQGYAFTNSSGYVAMNGGSTTVSKGLVGDKGTTTGFKGSAIPGNDTGVMHKENNRSCFDYASIASASEENFIVSQDATVNIVATMSSQNASEQSAESQVGQFSETLTSKPPTFFGSSTNIPIEVTLTSPPNTATTTAATTSTSTLLGNSDSATARRPTLTSQNMNGLISEEVTASPMSEDDTECRNMATIHFENAVTTVATSISLGEFESTSATSLPPSETTCSSGNDTSKTTSGNSFCVPVSAARELHATAPKETPISIGKPISEFTGVHGGTFNETVRSNGAPANNIVQDRKLSVATIGDDSKTPLDTIIDAPGDITSANNISLLSRELDAIALGDAANNTSDSASINASGSGDTSEDAHYEGRITSGHSRTEPTLDGVSTPDFSFSIRTNFQEASKGPGDTTTLSVYPTDTLEGALVCHEFVHSKIPTVPVQTPKFNDTAAISGGGISAEAARQSESSPTAKATSSSADNSVQSETLNAPVNIGAKDITSHQCTEILNKSSIPDSISTSMITGISEATAILKESRNTTLDANSAFSAGDAATITSTKSTGATAPGGSGDFMKTTTLLKDTTTFTTTSTGATVTVTALKGTVMTTQTSMRDVAPVSRNKTTTILEDTSTPRETVASEKMAAATHGNIVDHSEVLIPGTSSCEGNPVGNINPKETLNHDPSGYSIDRVTTDLLTTTNTINILSDTTSIPNNASSLLEVATSPKGILTSGNNRTTTHVQIGVQSQTTISETPSTVTEKDSATEENATTITPREAGIVHPAPEDATTTNTPEDETNSSVTINNSENFPNFTVPSVSPREVVTSPCIPLGTTTNILGKTAPSEQRFCSRNGTNTNTSLDVSAHLDYSSPTEVFSTLSSTSLSDTRPLVEVVTPCLSTISMSEYSSQISANSSGLENAVTPMLFQQGTNQSIATKNTTSSEATTEGAAFSGLKSTTASPGDIHTLMRTTIHESGESVATSCPEQIPTTFGAAVTYKRGKSSGTDVAKYMIAATTVSEETIAAPEDNIPDQAIPRDKNPVSAVASIHARAHEEAMDDDGDPTLGPRIYQVDANVIPTCTATISLREIQTPSASTVSKATDIVATTAVVGRSPTASTIVVSGQYPALKVTMVTEDIAVSGIITTARETFVPKITTSLKEAFVSRSATEFPLASSSEATIFPAETSTGGATFSSGQTAASINASSKESVASEDLTVMTTSSSTSFSANVPFTPFDIGTKLFEDDAYGASGDSYIPENKAFPPEDTTVPEDTTIVAGNICKVSEGPVLIPLGNDMDSPAKETSTTAEGALSIATTTPRNTIDTITAENSITTLGTTIIVPEETPTVNLGDKTMVAHTMTETAMITGWSSDGTGEGLTAAPKDTNIATLERVMVSPTRETFLAPSEARIISPGETFAATSGKITGPTYLSTSPRGDLSHEDASDVCKEAITGIPRETAPVKLGKATATITGETTMLRHRKISTAVPRKTFTSPNSGASPDNAPGEIPTTALAEAAYKTPPLSVHRDNMPTGVTPEETSMAVSSKTAATSQEKNRTVTSLPHWSIMLIGMTVIVILLAGFCMVIYYVTVFIWVAFSATLSSNSFS